MNAKQFFDLVAELRTAQKTYFKTRSFSDLQKSKRLEKEVDAEILRVHERLTPQLDLFTP